MKSQNALMSQPASLEGFGRSSWSPPFETTEQTKEQLATMKAAVNKNDNNTVSIDQMLMMTSSSTYPSIMYE